MYILREYQHKCIVLAINAKRQSTGILSVFTYISHTTEGITTRKKNVPGNSCMKRIPRTYFGLSRELFGLPRISTGIFGLHATSDFHNNFLDFHGNSSRIPRASFGVVPRLPTVVSPRIQPTLCYYDEK